MSKFSLGETLLDPPWLESDGIEGGDEFVSVALKSHESIVP
jgi:hypothetical protein